MVGPLAVAGLLAQSASPAGFKRIPIQTADLSIPGKESVMVIGEFQPGVTIGRHTHPGEEITYLLEGTIILMIEGRPDRTVKAGEAFIIEAGKIHDARNVGSGVARTLATYVVDKGKPLATPAK
jgi:quercetin dioxygenase-like cupin family protein